MGMVRVGLPGVIGVAVLVRLLIFEISETQAVVKLTIGAVTAAGTAAAETILSSLYAFSMNHAVDEVEIARQYLVVDLVDHCDRDCLVRRKGAKLTPVTILFLSLQTLWHASIYRHVFRNAFGEDLPLCHV